MGEGEGDGGGEGEVLAVGNKRNSDRRAKPAPPGAPEAGFPAPEAGPSASEAGPSGSEAGPSGAEDAWGAPMRAMAKMFQGLQVRYLPTPGHQWEFQNAS